MVSGVGGERRTRAIGSRPASGVRSGVDTSSAPTRSRARIRVATWKSLFEDRGVGGQLGGLARGSGLDPQHLDAVRQAGARQAQLAGGARHHAAVLAQDVRDDLALGVVEVATPALEVGPVAAG